MQSGDYLFSTIDDAATGGMGPAMRRYLQTGLYNGDFASTSPAVNAQVTGANPIPFWTYTQASGTAVSASVVEDSGSASGFVVQWTMTAGAAGDDAYIEQIAPVAGSQARSFVYLPAATFETAAVVNLAQVYCSAQFLLRDGVTTTGTSSIHAKTTADIGAGALFDVQPAPGGSGVVPADAYYVRVRIGLRRGSAATSDSVTVQLHEARIATGGPQVIMADTTDPASYGYASIYQANGVFWLQPNNPGATGFGPKFVMNATNGYVTLRVDNDAAVILAANAGEPAYLAMSERSVDAPASGANDGHLFLKDNGAGKTQLCIRFSSGAVQVIATQP